MREPLRDVDHITDKVIGAAIEVHKSLGPGLLESAYQTCLAHEMKIRGIQFEKEKPLPIIYKGVQMDMVYRLDFLVEKKVILELKAVREFDVIHQAQLLSYLKLSNLQLGLLMNFNVKRLTFGGIKRVANKL